MLLDVLEAVADDLALDEEEILTFASMLVRRGSLPFLGEQDVERLEDEPDDVIQAIAGLLDEVQVRLARESPAAFVQYAFRHEETDDLIENAEHHEEWHDFLDGYDRAILFAPVEHAKSQHVALGRTIYRLGQNPNKRFAIISNTAEPHATKILGAIRKHIDSNPRVRRVFPELRPSARRGDPWGQTQITVERQTIAKDPSVQSLGVYGPINGSRLDGIILDDVLNFENTRTPEQITKLLEWLDAEVFTRVTEDGWIWWIGTPWTPADPMHVVAARKGWTSRRYSAVTNPDAPMAEWRPLWCEQFDVARLAKIYEGTTPIAFGRKYLCKVRTDSASRFAQAWIDGAVALGRGYRLERRQPASPNGELLPCFTGVDLGVGQKEGHDLTAIFTICIDHRRKKRVVDIQAGRFTAPDIIQRLHDVSQRYGSIIYVENNAAQDFIVQWAGADGLPVRGYTTTAGRKFDERFGVESIAVEMRAGGWAIPSGEAGEALHPELDEWIREMLFYQPSKHTGDRLMASWLAREAARGAGMSVFGAVDTLAR